MRVSIFVCLLTCLLFSLSAQRKRKSDAREDLPPKAFALRMETLIIEGSRLLILGNYPAGESAGAK
jgi:hypothetical protein